MKIQKFSPLLVIAAGLVAYYNSFKGVFVFDDTGAILENPTIRHLWPLGPVLTKATFATVVSRPLLNLSLALNYALGGTNPFGYHVVNLLIHVLAGLTLFGVLRRTFRLPSLQDRLPGRAPTGLALAAALLWTVHPLQTESVTYVCQRAESLAGLFYLLVFYNVLRAVDSPHPRRWYGLAILACWLGVTVKETLVTAPVLLLVYDRIFLTSSWKTSLRSRWVLYGGLAASWILLAVLVLHSGGRENSAGFGRGLSAWEYARTQPYYIVRYLMLAFWPNSLVLDYGAYVAKSPAEIVPYALIVGALLGATLWCLRVSPKLGYCGLWFFGTLAPTSSFVPLVTQTGAEHRIYLSLAAVVTVVVIGFYKLLVVSIPDEKNKLLTRRNIGVALAIGTTLTLVTLTIRRNDAYRTEVSIWNDTVAKRPDNARAHGDLGRALLQAGRLPQAIAQCQQALRIKPDYVEARLNMGTAFLRMGKTQEAINQYKKVLGIDPEYAEARFHLGLALAGIGRTPDAIEQYDKALQIKPDYIEARVDMANALFGMGKVQEAIDQYKQALRLKPDYAEVHLNLGLALEATGRAPEAIEQYEQALRLRPDLTAASKALARVRGKFGQSP